MPLPDLCSADVVPSPSPGRGHQKYTAFEVKPVPPNHIKGRRIPKTFFWDPTAAVESGWHLHSVG